MNTFDEYAHSEPTYQEFLERDEAIGRSAGRRYREIENTPVEADEPEASR